MRNFVNQCVVYDAMLGRKYTIEDLRHSDDIWGLVSASASPIRSFVYREPHALGSAPNRAEIITCREGITKLNSLWKSEVNRTATLFGTKIFGKCAFLNPKIELFKYLPLAHGYLTKSAKSAEQIIQQQMMIHSIVDGIEQKSIELGNSPNFATRRAYLQQRTTYETLGNLASESLPVMKNVIEALAYAAFIFILPLALLPMGWKVIEQWGGLILWVQMWAPLYAVLNFIMTVSAKSKSIAAVALSNENGVTIANSVGLMNANADMAAMAGYLAMSIPFISWALVKGGAGAFVQLATHLGSVTQGVAGTAANEQATGNYSFGNVSQSNVQAYNTSALQHNTSPSYQSGQFRQMDGRTDMTTTADGQHILNVANSNLPTSINYAATESQQLSERASKAWTASQQQMQASSEQKADAYRKVLEFATHQANQQQLGRGLSYGESASTNIQAADFKQKAEQFATDNNLTIQELASLLAGVSAGLSFGVFGMKGDASVSSQSSKGELFRKAEDFVEQHQLQETLSKAVQGMKEERFNKSDEKGQRLAESISASIDSSQTFRKEAQASLQEAHSLSSQADYIRSNASTINQNLNQEFVDWMVNQPYQGQGKSIVGLDETRRLLSSTDPKHREMVQHYARDFLNQNRSVFESSPAQAVGVQNLQDTYQSFGRNVERQYPSNSSSFDRVKHHAKENGFNLSEDRKNSPEELQKKVEGLFQDNQSSLASKQNQLEKQSQQLKQNVFDGQKRGLIESAAKGPLSHLAELGRKVKADLKKATDE